MSTSAIGQADQRPRRDAVLAVLGRYAPALEALGLREIGLFGSVARDTAKPIGSDVDVLVRAVDPNITVSTIVQAQQALSNAVGHPTNLVLLGLGDVPVVVARLDPSLINNIQPDLVPVADTKPSTWN